MVMYLNFNDLLLIKGKNDRIARNTKYITNFVMGSVVLILIGTGTIGVKIIGECIVVGSANKVTKYLIKKIKNR